MFVLLVVSGVYLTNFISRTESTIRTAREIEIISAINNLEFTKINLQSALDYSVYQSFYDLPKQGGYSTVDAIKYSDNKPYWRVYNDVSGFPDYAGNLSDQISRYFSSYTARLEPNDISIPSYEMTAEVFDGSVRVNASTFDNLEDSGGFYTITDHFNISKIFGTNILRLFEIGKEKFVDQDILKVALTNALQNLISTSPECKNGGCQNRLTLNIRDEIHNLESNIGNCKIDLLGIQTEACTNCDYGYHAVSEISVQITDPSSSYLVYDGTIDYRPLTLKFYITSSDDYQYQPVAVLVKQSTQSVS